MYSSPLEWINKYQQEDVRLAMFDFRRHGVEFLDKFEYLLENTHRELNH